MDTFERDQYRFEVISHGDSGEVILLLHGFPSTASSWTPIAKRFARVGYRTLAPLQRGYSPRARPGSVRSYVLEELVDDVVALIKATGAKRIHLVGHDWGGVVAWALASRYPELLKSLTIISTPHPKAFMRSFLQSRQLLLSWYVLFFQLKWLPESIIRRKRGSSWTKLLVRSGLNITTASDYAANMQDDKRLSCALNWYRAVRYEIGYLSNIKIINTPTMYIYGGKDKFISRKAADLTKRWVKGEYHFRFMPNETHWIPEESPEVLARLILEFISSASSLTHLP